MALPTPNLDDRRFQDLVDEAKRMVQQRCPEWTDHNVSDPGVTLIETFAFMVDQLLYRLNRVPDLHYLKFLDLIGVQPFPPTAATGDVTFWLSAAQENPIRVPVGTEVASVRTETEDPVIFTVTKKLDIVPSSLVRVALASPQTAPVDRTDEVQAEGQAIPVFSPTPQPGDSVLFGLSSAVPNCAILLRVEAQAEGVGVDPRDPPWTWEAWDGAGWATCEVDWDTTGGFNKPGDIVLHVPGSHTPSVVGRARAGWLRCRVTEPEEGQRFYSLPPKLFSASASTIGGTASVAHADIIVNEIIGESNGSPGQRFKFGQLPLVAPDGPMLVEVSSDDGWQEWTQVSSFAESQPTDRHFTLDPVAGELTFGPSVRLPEGGMKHYGAIPAKGAVIRVPEYRTGGGRRGNVARGVLQVQREPIPFVSSVINRRAATGGVDGESVEDAAVRGPLLLRTKDRAVTAEDYEALAIEAAPEAARIRCVPVEEAGTAVRVLVVPAVGDTNDLQFADLKPSEELLKKIAGHLSGRRCVGARVAVEPPFYQGVTVVAQLTARNRTSSDALRARALRTLDTYFNPITGGADGKGWPFGRPVQAGEVFAVLQRLRGVEIVEGVQLFAADPVTGDRGEPVQRIDLASNALVFSYRHQIRVR
jgi:predicted phage baseplate assembly protein